MKQTLTNTNIVLSLIIILAAFRVDEYLIRFLVIGELPNGAIVPAPLMLSIILSVIALIALRAAFVYVLTVKKTTLESYTTHLPKKRYSE